MNGGRVLQVDAIWVTQLVPTGGTYRDRKGRKRAKKGRIKRPILLAMGIWPEQDYAQILAWTLGESEDEEACGYSLGAFLKLEQIRCNKSGLWIVLANETSRGRACGYRRLLMGDNQSCTGQPQTAGISAPWLIA